MQLTFVLIAYLQIFLIGISASKNEKDKEKQKATRLPPCAACKVLTDSFKKAMDETERGKFEGGDAAWEEEKMKTYKKSEVRFVEIQEHLCQEVQRGQNQCLASAEEHEDALENWWFNIQDTVTDIHEFLCIDSLKVCCPANHFGPNCLPCKGGIESPCSGNGKCKGGGTRKGNGECDCNEGYVGELCNECISGFYESYKDELKILCDPCHKACIGSCTGAGAKSCLGCNKGWIMNSDKGCLDIDECLDKTPPCGSNEVCINTEGNYTCLRCDKACDGCTGDGPDMCIKCATNYKEDETGACIDTVTPAKENSLTNSRYITYGGLTIATCIILQKHPVAAAAIGLAVASYISFSEYYLTHMLHEPKRPLSPKDLGMDHL